MIIRLDQRYAEKWYCVDDPVMGGLSKSNVNINEHNQLEWKGKVSLENGGGFASVRCLFQQPLNLQKYSGINVHAVGDGKMYKLNMANNTSSDSPRFQARFTTDATDKIAQIPFAAVESSVRGKKVTESFDPSYIVMLGFLIADQQQGPFHLTIKSITAYV